MDQFYTFVAIYATVIVSVIVAIVDIYFKGKNVPKDENEEDNKKNKGTVRDSIVKAVGIGFLLGVLIICYGVYRSQTLKGGDVNPTETVYTHPLQIGDEIPFGAYKPDGISGDPETIVWQVLDIQGDKALLLSRDALDSQPYNETYGKTTWESCFLHSWLNSAFLDAAFTAEERTAIVSAERNDDSRDTVFLLSYEEADRYFRNEEDRICKPTDYVASMNGKTREIEDGCAVWWWLRTMAEDGYQAFYVNFEGKCYTNVVANDYLSVRPALWIDVEKYRQLS